MASWGSRKSAATNEEDYSFRETIKEQYQVSGQGAADGRDRFPASGGRGRKMGRVYNDDPGVNESEDETQQGWTNYEDREEFFNELKAIAEKEPVPDLGHRQADIHNLHGTGDYHGLGGPHSIPMASEGAFERPSTRPHQPCLLDELFLAPSPDQLLAYERIQRKREIARNKSRFKWSVLCHIFLALVIVAKLIPAILDRLDIFVLEIEELFIPKPLLWEWLWLLSVPCTFLGLSACKKSNHSRMTKSFYGLIVFGLLPILFGLAYYGMGVLTYAKNKSTKGIETWKGYPVPLLWYAFFFLAIQAHLFELFVARKLIQAWQPRRKQH